MNLNRVFVSVIIFLGSFTLIFGFLPSAFYTLQTGYSNPSTHDREVAVYFDSANITLYENSWSFNITANSMETNSSGLPEGHQMEFHWDQDILPLGYIYIHIKHAEPSAFFGLWLEGHWLTPIEPYATQLNMSTNQIIFYKENIIAGAQGTNSTQFEVRCDHISQNFVIMPINDSISLSDSWDDGNLHVLTSYEIDFEAMKPSAWVLLTQLLSFQSPDLGISGTGGTILNYLLGITIWASISILIYAIVTSLIPLISGWRGG